jgi:DNA-binding NarL/FixJ family response regulator
VAYRTADGKKEEESMSALIVAQPGLLQDSLRMLMMLVPEVGAISVLEDTTTARARVVEQDPGLVVLDAAMPGDALSLVESIRSRRGATRCVVLVDDVQEQQSFQAAGAALVVLKGHPAARLRQEIRALAVE